MKIDPAACEWYKLGIATEPAATPTEWEASFDGGDTWLPAHEVDSLSGWLIAGPEYDGEPVPDVTLSKRTKVKVRLIDDPETVIRDAPTITV